MTHVIYNSYQYIQTHSQKCYKINNSFQYNINMANTTLTKVASAFKDNYQKYSIPILDDNFLDKSLDHVKTDTLKTLTNISNKFNRFKASIILEVDDNTVSSYPLEVKYGKVDIGNIDYLIDDILEKYEELLEFDDIKNYIYI